MTKRHRFYYEDWKPTAEEIRLEGEEAWHGHKVRRLKAGDDVEIFDGRGHWAWGVIRESKPREIVIDVKETSQDQKLPARQVNLAVSPSKGDRLDWLVEKATELGVRSLILIKTERTIVDPRDSKVDRLRKLSIEACKQSGRNQLLDLIGPISWSELLAKTAGHNSWVCHPQGEQLDFVGLANIPLTDTVTFAIGPEGGFTNAEVEEAGQQGWRTCRLTPTILRIETAALAVASLCVCGTH